jgi:hypothetical protein
MPNKGTLRKVEVWASYTDFSEASNLAHRAKLVKKFWMVFPGKDFKEHKNQPAFISPFNDLCMII